LIQIRTIDTASGGIPSPIEEVCAVAHISDVVLDCSRGCLRLAAKSSDDHIAAELQLVSLRLLLAAVGDAELTVDESPIPIPA
jgi:hypothetical protein